jgi:ABC-2 type transport system permease protein
MAVYDHLYAPYTGRLTREGSRFLVITRHALRELFKSKIVTGLFVLCFVYPLIAAIIIYLRHNANAMSILEIDLDDIIPINATFFSSFIQVQTIFGFVLTVLVGPSLVAADLANNALPLYLSRPLSRAEYIFGKFAVLALLLSAITWVPGVLLVLLQSSLTGSEWVGEYPQMLPAVFFGSVVWIVLISLLSLTISAVVKWAIAARALLFAIFIVPSAVGAVINEIFHTKLGSAINLNEVVYSIWIALFGSDTTTNVGPVLATTVFAIVCAFCLAILARRVRAYEVVR